MKYIRLILVIKFLLLPITFMGQTIELEDLVFRDNLAFKKFENIPFTGPIYSESSDKITFDDLAYIEIEDVINNEVSREIVESSYHFNCIYTNQSHFVIKGFFKNGKKHGLWECYYNDGALYWSLNLDLGTPFGTFSKYRRNGTVIERGEFLKGKKNGIWENFHDNNILKSSIEFKNGSILNLEIKRFSDENILLEKIPLKNGMINGKYQNFSYKGNLIEEFNVMNNTPVGEYIEYYSDGNVRLRSYFEKGKLFGTGKKFSKEGKVIGLIKYINGKMEYIEETFYENGTVKNRRRIKNYSVLSCEGDCD